MKDQVQIEQLSTDKQLILRELESWKIRAIKSEERVKEVETDIKGLFLENERLNTVIVGLHKELENLQLSLGIKQDKGTREQDPIFFERE